MCRSSSGGIGAMALLWTIGLLLPWAGGVQVGAGAADLAAASADNSGWTVIFRADNPLLWNTNAGDSSSQNGYAIQLTSAPAELRFLKLTRMDTAAAVIIALGRGAKPAPWKPEQLTRTATLDGNLVWDGGQFVAGANKERINMLGIGQKSWTAETEDQQMVMHQPGKNVDTGFRGWGFSRQASKTHTQGYSWEGGAIDKTVFEIAVKRTALSSEERAELLTAKPAPAGNTPAPAEESPTPTQAFAAAGSTTPLLRFQATIKALYILHENNGDMLGDAADFILTATPGTAKGGGIPVTFATKVGPQMHLVLEDVLRAVNVKYPHVAAQKYEFSFEDKYDDHDGGSIGAACGMLLLSLIQNFDIDPRLAITGDVAANGKIHAIGGVAAKIRGAVAAHCDIVVVPSENVDQVADAFVYDGPAPMTNVQVIAVENLDDAAGLVRADRDVKLKQAIDLFAEVQTAVKAYPERIHQPENIEKLNQVLELVPNHLSARYLLLQAQNKQPRGLTGGATEYYTNVALEPMLPDLFKGKAKVNVIAPGQPIIQDCMAKIQKVRKVSDPQFLSYVNMAWEFARSVNDLGQHRATNAEVLIKAQAVIDALAKLDTDKTLQEKMLHEGI